MVPLEIERRKYTRTYISIAPMVDVVFLLLLFFMLTSHLVQEPAIKIVLPESKTAAPIDNTILTLSVSSSRRSVFVRDREVDIDALSTALKNHIAQHDTSAVRIKTDRQVHVGRLVRVIDQVKLAGIRSFAIVTERRKKDTQ